MSLVQGSFGGIAGGVSQQPDISRFPGQCSEQTNMVIDTVEGLRRRGAFDVIKVLDAAYTSGDAYIHWFSLESGNYMAILTPAGIKVFDMGGTEYPVDINGTSYADYFATFNNKYISTAQVGEYNMMCNAHVIPEMSPDVEVDGEWEYVTFHVSDGMQWGVAYVLNHNNVEKATYQADAGDNPSAGSIATTSSINIMAGLYATVAPAVIDAGWEAQNLGNTIVMRRGPGGGALDGERWSFEDSIGNSSASCTINVVQTIDDLPPKAWPGQVVQVKGSDKSDVDDFFMVFQTTDGHPTSNGTWSETHDRTQPSSLDENTMPHTLIPLNNADPFKFYFTPLIEHEYEGSAIDKWATRTSGNKASNPPPSFIGSKIYDMSVVQNRLTFVSDDHVTMSVVAKEFTFWDQSALTSTDTDPLELATPGNAAAHLFSAIEHEQNLLILGDKRQFAVPLRSALSKGSAALVPTTAYDVDRGCRPAAAAGGMFFSFSDGQYSGVREYHTGDVDTIHVADEITAHVGDYIPPNIKGLYSDRQEGIIYVIHDDSSDIFRYHFLEQKGERVISAWSKITMPQVVPISMYSLNGNFYVVSQGPNGLLLTQLQNRSKIFLDFKALGTVFSDGTVDLSSWQFKDLAHIDNIICLLNSGPYKGMHIQTTSYTPGELTIHNPLLFEGEQVVVGIKAPAFYTPTMPVVRDQKERSLQLDRLTVNSVSAFVHDTGDFGVRVAAEYYPDTEQRFSGMSVGKAFTVGESTVSDRTVNISVGHDARSATLTFHTDKSTDLIIQSLEYKGNLTKRGQRL